MGFDFEEFEADNKVALYIEKAYIDSLTISVDIIEKAKEWWHSFVDGVEDVWNRLLGVDNNIKEEDGKEK